MTFIRIFRNMNAFLYYGIDEIHLVNAFKNYPIKLEIKENGYDSTASLLYQMEILSKLAPKFSELPNYDIIPKE